jgi:tetratricopeptide (TPR) repeat protein
MPEDRKLRLRDIFDAALRCAPKDRERYLEDACQGDPRLASEVRALIAAFVTAGEKLDPTDEDATRTLPVHAGELALGTMFAGRYRILAKLGEGGMGAVYKARDLELDRDVALKLIRPEMVASQAIQYRFRTEVVLAQKITHRNVVRIYDLGVSGADRYFTMEFVPGDSLMSILRTKGRLEPSYAAGIMTQVADGLAAAHAVGVVHRDLKAPNIMVGTDGRVTVMDFGIARSLEDTGITRLGDIIGTPDYMAPEHARGELVDGRSDIFSLGIIFWELLMGKLPFQRVAEVGLVKRTQVPATPVSKADPAIPEGLSRIVAKCLALEPDRRYQSASELVSDLVNWQTSVGLTPPITQVVVAPGEAKKSSRRGMIVAVTGAAAAGAVAAYFARERGGSEPSRPPSPVSLLIADFDNQTGDSQFDGSLEPMFALAMEDASFIDNFDRGAARKAAAQVKPSAVRLDRETARLVAVREGIQVVVNGEIAKHGGTYVLKVEPVDTTKGAVILTRQDEAEKKNDILKVVGRLAAPVRRALGDKTPEAQQLAAETFTAGSLEAARTYGRAQEAALAGKYDDAIAAYKETILLDPRMGRAYAGLAVAYRNVGRVDEAVEQYKRALEYIERMSEREKFRTRGGYFVTVNNQAQAVEQFRALVEKFPADSGGHSNLALSYLLLRDTKKALQEGRMASELYPKNLTHRNNVALYAMYAGAYDETVREAAEVLKQDPQFPKALVATAVANLATGKRQEAMDAYRRLNGSTPLGQTLGVIGLADIALYEGRAKDAAELMESTLEGKLPLGARRQVVLAESLLASGKKAAALAMARKAAEASASHQVRVSTALVAIAAGDELLADAAVKLLDAKLTDEMTAYARLLEAEKLRQTGKPQDAVRKAQESVKTMKLWLGHYTLGRAYLDAKAFPEAQEVFDNCLSRGGEATAIFMDDLPSLRYLGPVNYYAGIAAAGIGGGGKEPLEKFLAIRQGADAGDPLLADARKRLGK